MSSASESQKGSPFHLFSTYPFQSDEVYQVGPQNNPTSTLTQTFGYRSKVSQASSRPDRWRESPNRRKKPFSTALEFSTSTGALCVDLDSLQSTAHKCTYASITGHSISEEEARPSETPLAVEAAPTTTTASVQETPGDVLTFDQLKDLIERGKADLIPNNRHIPEGLNVSAGLCVFSSRPQSQSRSHRNRYQANRKPPCDRNRGRSNLDTSAFAFHRRLPIAKYQQVELFGSRLSDDVS
jgi:hypothetical protein